MKHRPLAGIAALAAAVLAVTAVPVAAFADAATPQVATAGAAASDHDSSSCLWYGPTFTLDASVENYALPDSGAHYWSATFTIPVGATLQLHGQFAHARYQSLNAYNITTHSPISAVNDVSTVPDKGSKNPYLPNAHREGEGNRDYTVTVSAAVPPAPGVAGAPNTVYAGVAGQIGQLLVYRTYLPDNGLSLTGGEPMPTPILTLSDGTKLTGDAACTALSTQHVRPPFSQLPPALYASLRDQPGKPSTFPADPATAWHVGFNTQYTIGCLYMGACGGHPFNGVGQYANLDNSYAIALANRQFGHVLVLHGKVPVTPQTVNGEKRMDADVDMRYWSLCTNEGLATTRATDCAHDDQITTDAAGYYTIAISRTADRPATATAQCGVTWLEWPENGDGVGHPDDMMLAIRNMLPSSSFTHAVQDVKQPGDERSVMGDYLPTSVYTSVAGFQAPGC